MRLSPIVSRGVQTSIFFLSFADFHSLTRRTSPEKDELLVVYAQVYPYLLPETKTRQIKKIVDSVNSTFSDIGKFPFELDKEKLGELLLKQTYPN